MTSRGNPLPAVRAARRAAVESVLLAAEADALRAVEGFLSPYCRVTPLASGALIADWRRTRFLGVSGADLREFAAGDRVKRAGLVRDLIAAGCAPADRMEISGVRIGAWLRGVHLAIQLVGFGRALRILSVATPAYARADVPSAGFLTALKHAVESHGRRSLLVGGDCKAEAMTAFLLLRRCGLGATLSVGLREHPFSLHAWTSSNGISIPDPTPGGHVFTPVLSISGE